MLCRCPRCHVKVVPAQDALCQACELDLGPEASEQWLVQRRPKHPAPESPSAWTPQAHFQAEAQRGQFDDLEAGPAEMPVWVAIVVGVVLTVVQFAFHVG